MSIANLLVRIRTAGAASLAALQAQLLLLGATAGSVGRGGLSALGDGIAAMGPKLAVVLPLVTALVAVLLPLTAAVVSLIGTLQLLAPAAIGAGLALGVLVMAFRGVGGAISAGLSGDMEKFNKALKGLVPAAQEFVRAFVKVVKQWVEIKHYVQQSFFGTGDLGAAFQRLSDAVRPVAEKWLPILASNFSMAIREILDFITYSANAGRLDQIFGGAVTGISGFLQSISALFRVFMDIATVAAPAFGQLGQQAGSAADKFAEFIRKAKEDGSLSEWLEKGKKAFGTIKDIIGDLSSMLKSIFKSGADDGQDLLETIRELTRRTAEWLASAEGQEFIQFLADIGNFIMDVLVPTIIFLSKVFKTVLYVAILVAISLFQALLAVAAAAFGWVPGLGPKLKEASDKVNAFAADVTKKLLSIPDDPINVYVNVRYRVIGGIPHRASNLSGTYDSGIGGRASGGPVIKGKTYMVGEHGPEMVTFGQSGVMSTATETARAMRGTSSGAAMSGGPMRVELVAGGGNGPVAELIHSLIRSGALRLQVRQGNARVGVVTAG